MNEQILMKCGCLASGVLSMRAGARVDPPIPWCVVHACDEIAQSRPDLTGRRARCYCGKTQPSSFDLAFFEHRGAGSRPATLSCKCGFYEIAHGKPHVNACAKFTPRGAQEFDSFYSGCRGWD